MVSAGGWWDDGAWQAARRAWLDTSTEPAHLVLPDASGRDEGSYRCKVHFRSSPSWSQSVALTVIGQYNTRHLSPFIHVFNFISPYDMFLKPIIFSYLIV